MAVVIVVAVPDALRCALDLAAVEPIELVPAPPPHAVPIAARSMLAARR
jgi:hypothetical protein